jgi:5-methylcytosine-specific restriction endonuclease McrBC GTP-binding regulatory subunit McrB
MELQHLIDLIKELTPGTKCKYVRGEDYCTFVGVEEDEPRVNGLTPTGDKHSVSGSYLSKLAESIKEYVPFNISQLMNNSGSNRPVIESIIAHTSEFYWIQFDRARYVVWIPSERHDPNLLSEWKDTESLKRLELAHTALESKRRKGNPDKSFAKKIENLLKAKKNLVLTGAPGTGKTYIAKQVAASIVSDGSADWSGLSADQREQVGFVQFHPSFDYTDFVEGLRPDKDGNFSRQDGIFKEFCKKAINNPEDKFVFIIDEINRGELSKIFGELFYSIEPDYRGLEGRVKTQYINMVEDDDEFKEGFYIPENVYIIGTMNDVDRGVEAMDFAIRRRFAWKEVTAEESAANMGITGTALAKMNKINEVIKEKLGQAYCIGGAYFRKLDGGNFADLWDNHLSGIVTEYFRGEPEADARIAEIKAAYDAAEEKKEESNLAPAPAEAETTPAAE